MKGGKGVTAEDFKAVTDEGMAPGLFGEHAPPCPNANRRQTTGP